MEVNLPSQQVPPIASQANEMKKSKYSSALIVYGCSIIVLAIVITGIVLDLSNVRIPYLSSFYLEQVPPLPVATAPVARDESANMIATSTATTTRPVATTTPSKKT
jgi:hypothetical protein